MLICLGGRIADLLTKERGNYDFVIKAASDAPSKYEIGPNMSNLSASSDSIRHDSALDHGEICRAMVWSDPDAVYFRDREGICQMANPVCAETFGVELGTLIGSPLSRFFSTEAACTVLQQEESVLADGEERGCEVMLSKDRPYWIGHSVVLGKGGEKGGVIGRLRSIADRKRLEGEIVEAGERVMRRIARDLHDDLCQELAATALIAKLLQKRLADGDEAPAKVAAHIADITRQMASRARGIIYNLSPAALAGDAFVASLRNLATQICEVFPVKCGIEGNWPRSLCDDRVAMQLYRIAHEAMHNAAKHSGGKCITVRLKTLMDVFALTISDNGHGISSKNTGSPGLGISSMRYRAGLIGGSLLIQSMPGGGTSVTCKVPIL